MTRAWRHGDGVAVIIITPRLVVYLPLDARAAPDGAGRPVASQRDGIVELSAQA